jgi:NAD(P)-dependent dehydrogenase (short-subunit alcohol dehydrogenase family)
MTCAAELFDLSGRVVAVTGGSKGLGREMALAVARAGADVVVASRRVKACELVAEEVRALGARALPVACHVGPWDANSLLADTVWKGALRLQCCHSVCQGLERARQVGVSVCQVLLHEPAQGVPEPETTCRVGRMFATESTSPTKLAVELACMGLGVGLFP